MTSARKDDPDRTHGLWAPVAIVFILIAVIAGISLFSFYEEKLAIAATEEPLTPPVIR